MGKPKTAFLRADAYGLMKAAELAAELMSRYERHLEGPTEIRVELPTIPEWDDVSVEDSAGCRRWQVKRLTAPVDVSVLLGLLGAARAESPDPTRTLEFALGVAQFVDVTERSKVVFNLAQLAELCQLARVAGTDADEFAAQYKKRRVFALVSQALSGEPPSTILKCLRRLHIVQLGLEESLRERAAGHLRLAYDNAEELFDRVHGWVQQHADSVVRINADVLYREIFEQLGRRDPTRARWIYLERDLAAVHWTVQGPLPVRELASRAWQSDEVVRVQVAAPPLASESASGVVARLLLHQQGRIETRDEDGWRAKCLAACGETLGRSDAAPKFAWSKLERDPKHPPRERLTERDFATQLSHEMDVLVWNAFAQRVGERLHAAEIADDLRSAMLPIWQTWSDWLVADVANRAAFLRSLVATAHETKRRGFDAASRLGPGVADDLARATVAALAVSATLAASGIPTMPMRATDQTLEIAATKVHVLAITAASHPDDHKPRSFASSAGSMFATQTGIIVLGSVEASAGDLSKFASGESLPYSAFDGADNFRHPGSPVALLTYGSAFQAALRTGLAALKLHLLTELQASLDQRVSAIRRTLASEQAK